MLKRWWRGVETRVQSFLIVVLTIGLILPFWTPSAQAITLKGPYAADGLQVISVLRVALDAPAGTEEQKVAQSEAQSAMDAFNGRYHGDRFEKMQSFTMMRTVFNTVASAQRTGKNLSTEKKERVISQLNRAQSSFETIN